MQLRRYWINGCQTCPVKGRCTTGTERRITRWEHEPLIEAMRERLSRDPDPMTLRRCTVEHPRAAGGLTFQGGARCDPRLRRSPQPCRMRAGRYPSRGPDCALGKGLLFPAKQDQPRQVQARRTAETSRPAGNRAGRALVKRR
nr:hypothetical protein [Rhodobacter viridis]